MEPRREEPKAPTPQPKEKPRRFRIVKLEERIAPTREIGWNHPQGTHNWSVCPCSGYCGTGH
jgi:hypothetical protein